MERLKKRDGKKNHHFNKAFPLIIRFLNSVWCIYVSFRKRFQAIHFCISVIIKKKNHIAINIWWNIFSGYFFFFWFFFLKPFKAFGHQFTSNCTIYSKAILLSHDEVGSSENKVVVLVVVAFLCYCKDLTLLCSLVSLISESFGGLVLQL